MDIFSSPDVYKFEGQNTLDKPFFEDNRGFIQRIDKEGQKVNILFTKQGFMRSGDLHKVTQYDFIFSGKIELWLYGDGKDTKKIFTKNELIEIPAGIPHLFNFLEDSFIAEWWDGEFDAWYFRPYRKVIEGSL